MLQNSKTQNLTKHKNYKCDETKNVTKFRMWRNWKSQSLTTQKLKIWQNTKTQNVTKFKNLKCDKAQISKCYIPQKLKMWQNSTNQNVTTQNWICDNYIMG